MKDIVAYSLSQSQDSRLYVLEHTVYLEEMISSLLSDILGINRKESKSLGFGSGSLSFKQKVQLIQDMKGVDKKQIKKLDTILEIRNKFAHVKAVDSFESYSDHSKNSKNNLRQLERWFEDKQGIEDDQEEQRRYNFYLLFKDNFDFLFKLHLKHMYVKGRAEGNLKFHEKFVNKLKVAVQKSPEANRIWNDTLDELSKDSKKQERK